MAFGEVSSWDNATTESAMAALKSDLSGLVTDLDSKIRDLESFQADPGSSAILNSVAAWTGSEATTINNIASPRPYTDAENPFTNTVTLPSVADVGNAAWPEFDFSAYSATSTLARYDSAFLEAIEQDCRESITSAATSVLSIAQSGITGTDTHYRQGYQQQLRATVNEIEKVVADHAKRGFPKPTGMLMRDVAETTGKFMDVRMKQHVVAATTLSNNLHDLIATALNTGISVEEIRSRAVAQLQQAYHHKNEIALEEYRMKIEQSKAEARLLLENFEENVKIDRFNVGQLTAEDRFEIEKLDGVYRRGLQDIDLRYKVGSDAIARRLDAMKAVYGLYASWVASVASNSQVIATNQASGG